ncbi:sigma-70 family RNA polymerase sigma factor [Micrococcus sp. TA1]|uniref:sigma-70 family RNA polymerase sigma factor n=1 Tax=Micrococcus sp. TA1 TaxID=681627 RepID=UPI001615F770|nr:sigma-70 family RNA polymerase sigma factor [Micrococcus sp. TA1]MBB5748560.1 putative transcriptional regulator [Micrococcus sp. TA1]
MSVSSPDTTGLDRKDLARSYLKMAGNEHRTIQAQLEESASKRAHFAAIGRKHGITYREIAEHYGVTEGAVRQMLKRIGGE